MKVSFFADVDNITNKRGTNELIIKIVTQEISDQNAGLIMALRNKYTNVLISTSEISDEEAKDIPDDFAPVAAVNEKSQSQRLRSSLYRLWESRYTTRYEKFETFYEAEMERMINEVKDKI